MQNTIIEPYKARVCKSRTGFIEDAQLILSDEPKESRRVQNLASVLDNFVNCPELNSAEMNSLLNNNLKENRRLINEYFTIFQNYGTGFTHFDRIKPPIQAGPRSVFRDVPYQFIFGSHHRGFLANIGFEPIQGGILVSQIQGVKDAVSVLSDFKWSRMLLSITEEWAYQFDIPKVCVLPSTRNKWGQVNGLTTGKLIYDVTAERMGYHYDPEREVYLKRLNAQRIDNDFVPQSCK